MRFGSELIKDARIETSVDDQRGRRHTLFPDYAVNQENLANGVISLDDLKTDLLIETDADVIVGEFIDIKLPDQTFKTVKIIWTSQRLVGCQYTLEFASVEDGPQQFTVGLSTRHPHLISDDAINAQSRPALKDMSLRARMWIIIGSALLLWIIIGALAYWLSS